MKKTASRLISLLLVLVMLLSLSPAVFASDSEEPEVEITEETVEETPEAEPETQELPTEPTEEPETEEPAEELPEDPAEELPEEEPEEEETPEEEGKTVKVTFTFTDEFRVAIPADGEFADAAKAEEEEIWSLEFSLVPGSYTWLAQAVGHKDSEVTELKIPEDSGDIAIALELEAYPYGLKGMELGFEMDAGVLEGKQFIVDNDLPNLVTALVPGEDYVEDEMYFLADTEEYALEVAEAYGAELVCYESGVAVIRLSGELTVSLVLEAASDESMRLPAISPNYIYQLDDPVEDGDGDLMASLAKAPSITWAQWKRAIGSSNVDAYMQYPSENTYPYQHDVLNTYEAWAVTTGNPSVRVVVVDSGIDSSHEDLNISGTSYFSELVSSAADENGHGTHCAGIIAARMGNGKGGAGIAPKTSLYAYRSLNSQGRGTSASVAAGINYAYQNWDADVISISIGGPYPDGDMEDAVKKAINDGGATVVIAAGNSGSNIMEFPGAYNIPGLICVGSTGRTGKQSGFSNYGSWVDVYAPGNSILSTVPGGYATMSGTSMATPSVAGACALYIGLFGHHRVTPTQVEKVIKSCKTGKTVDAYKVISKGYKSTGGRIFNSVLSYSSAAMGDLTDRYSTFDIVPENVDVYLNLNPNEGEYFAYTLDGSEPYCLDGELVNGTVYTGGPLDLSAFKAGDAVTITVRGIADNGELGESVSKGISLTDAVDFMKLNISGPEKYAAGAQNVFTVKNCFDEDITSEVTWKITDGMGEPYTEASVDEAGLITVKEGFSGKLILTATASNGASVIASLDVVPEAPVEANFKLDRVGIYAPNVGTSWGVGATWNSLGYVKTLTLYNEDFVLADKTTGQEDMAILQAYFHSNNGMENSDNVSVVWKSSKPSVASIEIYNNTVYVIAQKAGTAKITATAIGPSNKKSVSITVKVITPVSYLALYASTPTNVQVGGGFNVPCISAADFAAAGYDQFIGLTNSGSYVLAAGKSANTKVEFGDTYGKPSSASKKLEWASFLYRYNAETSQTEFLSGPGYYYTFRNGKVSVKKTMYQLEGFTDPSSKYDYYIVVGAWANINTPAEIGGTLIYSLQAPVTKMVAPFRKQVWSTYEYGDVPFYVYTNGYYYTGTFTVKSSNPKVVGAYTYDNANYVHLVTYGKKGTARITIRSTDGSGKSCSFTIVVR